MKFLRLCSYTVLGLVMMFAVSLPVLAADEMAFTLVCDSMTIEGGINTPDADATTMHAEVVAHRGSFRGPQSIVTQSDGAIVLPITSSDYKEGRYDIEVTATYGSDEVMSKYAMYLGGKTCDSEAAVKERVVVYAGEANDYFDNVEEVQSVPFRFIAAGVLGRVDQAVASTRQRFAMSSSPVYYDIPSRTTDPYADTLRFEQHYALLPTEYRDAQAYLAFKGLLVPIVMPVGGENENELLGLLDGGALLAPETPSMDTVGAVKMIYTHSLSLVQSPFAGVGSFLSLFSQEGDEFTVYVKNGFVNYDARTYTMTRRMQITPEQTDIIKAYKKDGADTMALITCIDGDVLGSTLGREVLFLERKAAELGAFQKSLVWIDDVPEYGVYKDAIDQYIEEADLDDRAVAKMVKKLEQVEEDTGNPLKVIATYGKYMASYDAVYSG